MGGKPLPKPSEVSDDVVVAWRSADDLIATANKLNGWHLTTLTESVLHWVRREARELGWDDVQFPYEYPSRTQRAGAVFVKRQLASISVIAKPIAEHESD